jgi:protein ImuA
MFVMTKAQAGAPLELPSHLQRQIWRGDQLSGAQQGSLATGHAALDVALPGGGWPCGALTEVLAAQHGVGEMRLLAPVLRAVTVEAGRYALLVAPPHVPYAPALAAWGVALERLVWVRATDADALWAAQQGLKHAGIGAVLIWLPRVRAEALRRLQVAAQDGNALAFALRPASAVAQSSPAPLRLLCTAAADQAIVRRPDSAALRVEIIKRRGPALLAPLLLHLPLAPPLSGRVLGREEESHVVDRRGNAVFAAGSGTAAVALVSG